LDLCCCVLECGRGRPAKKSPSSPGSSTPTSVFRQLNGVLNGGPQPTSIYEYLCNGCGYSLFGRFGGSFPDESSVRAVRRRIWGFRMDTFGVDHRSVSRFCDFVFCFLGAFEQGQRFYCMVPRGLQSQVFQVYFLISWSCGSVFDARFAFWESRQPMLEPWRSEAAPA
jgi:hypothetical protein